MFKSSDRDIDRNHFLMKPSRVKNMNAAEVQVTAEQIILDGQIHRDKVVIAPVQKVMDEEEMENYKLRKRTDFEQAVKMKRHYLGQWIAYALWEEKIKEIQRARSIFERCLEVDYKV
jgi:crooked neck